jgi:hypothetical protein
VKFRRDLDFDDLIETIDALAAEDIDKVVDWQLTESKAAKVEKGPARSGVLGSNWTTRIGTRIGTIDGAPWFQPRADEYLRDVEEAQRRLTGQSRSRYAVAPGTREFVAYETPPLNSFDPNDLSERVRYRRIQFDVQTMRDPMRDVLHVRLKWSDDGVNWRYTQTAVSYEALISLAGPVDIIHTPNVLPGRDIVVELDPARATAPPGVVVNPVQLFIEGPS